jgi:chromosome segregation ATPase
LIDQVKKENFSLKLKIFFLEERLAKLAPDHIDAALKENIDLRVDFQTCQQELKKHKRMCLDLNKVVESLQADLEAAQESVATAQNSSQGGNSDRERELEREVARLKEQLQRERASWSSQGSSSGRWPNAEDARVEINRLRDELDSEREEKERILSRQNIHKDLRSASRASMTTPTDNQSTDSSASRPQLEKKVQELKQDNASLLSQVNAQITMLSTRQAEKETLYAELESVKASLADLENEHQLLQRQSSRNRSTSSSSSASQQRISELEEEVLAYRDRFAGIALEMERKEAEIEDLLQDGEARDGEHIESLNKLQDEWRRRTADLQAERDELNDVGPRRRVLRFI